MFKLNFLVSSLRVFLLISFSLSCKNVDPCVVDCLLPGMWSGDVKVENEYLEIDTTLHIQLFEEEENVSGWLYHTNGKYQIQGKYSIFHCEEISVTGNLEWAENGEIFVKCLAEASGTSCIDLWAANSGAEADFYNIYGNESFDLENYEEIGDAAKDTFRCVY